MHSGFTRGLIIGGLIGASFSMMMGPDMMRGRTRRKMMRTGRKLLRRSGSVVGDIVDLIR
ncbi:MAG: YtxH domain-containing protein [Clostridiales bacterium]|nr:YtxH domain-containing protein [Eubacteriales bacterium]MDH7565521.1 YtxH domain-containing protein [Clostridiales bacterium]